MSGIGESIIEVEMDSAWNGEAIHMVETQYTLPSIHLRLARYHILRNKHASPVPPSKDSRKDYQSVIVYLCLSLDNGKFSELH